MKVSTLATQGQGNTRVFGLDVLRAIAVLTVVAGHSLDHGKAPEWVLRYIGPLAFYGVEIFYVLSGFLIGHILLRSVNSGKLHTRADIQDFWKRRWARTLPLYVFFLVLYLRFDYHGPADLRQVWSYFAFLQNLAWPIPPFFTHSWSLAVEEWFYLLLPVVFLGFYRVMKTDAKALLATTFVFVIVPLACRLALGLHVTDWPGFDNRIRQTVICRLDSIFVGVLCAYARLHWPTFFARAAKFWWLGLGLFFALYADLSVIHRFNPTRGWEQALYLPLLSISIALMVPAAANLSTTGLSFVDAFISHTSKVSYSLYLGHICMLTLVLGIMDQFGWVAESYRSTVVMYAALGAFYYAFANLTYLLVEQPYIRLRDARMGHSDVRSGNVAIVVDATAEPEKTAAEAVAPQAEPGKP
jgi:peptidoglycan/LPS O-acetylase OafA/YrhL